MAREKRETTIDGERLAVVQLPAMRSVKMMNRLARAVGPALLKSLAGADLSGGGKVSDMRLDLSQVGDGLQMLLDRLKDEDLEQILRELLDGATIWMGGTAECLLLPVFDEVFAGKAGTVLKLLKFALEVNYGNFLGALLANAGALGKQSLSGK